MVAFMLVGSVKIDFKNINMGIRGETIIIETISLHRHDKDMCNKLVFIQKPDNSEI